MLKIFGLVGRASQKVVLKDKGGSVDNLPNMAIEHALVEANPLEIPVATTSSQQSGRGRGRGGRPPKRRRGQSTSHEAP